MLTQEQESKLSLCDRLCNRIKRKDVLFFFDDDVLAYFFEYI